MILGIDTSTKLCSVALFDRKGVLCEAEEPSPNSHSEVITILIQKVLNEVGADQTELEAVIVADGPGSYTGLRIGASAAKGLCYVLDIPLLAQGHLRATALESIQKYQGKHYLASIDARRENVYALLMDSEGNEVISTELLDVKNVLNKRTKELEGPFILAGNGTSKVVEYLDVKSFVVSDVLNSAKNLRHEAYLLLDKQQFESVRFFEPFYMQSPRITQIKKLLL